MSEQQVGRLAFRVESDWWVAYYAKPDSMDDAVEMGRIAMGIVRDPERKDMFMALMKHALAGFFADRGTPIETWHDPEPAPESERSGSA